MSYQQRSVDWVISRAYVHAQRKATPPAAGTDKYNVLVAICDSMQRLFFSEPGIEWDVLYSVVYNGTITATDTFDLDDSIDYISKRYGDFVTINSADGTQVTEYPLVRPDQLYKRRFENAVAQVGRQLKFSHKFLSTDPQIGQILKVPAILFPDDLTTGSSLVSVPDPMWLVYMAAAEFDRNDVVKMGQYNNLLTLADQCMQKMKADNGGQYDSIPLAFNAQGQSWL